MFATKDYSARGAGDILKHFQLGIVIDPIGRAYVAGSRET